MNNKRETAYETRETSQRIQRYREKIVEMVGQIENEKFLNQIRIILKRHIEKRGG